MVSTMTPFRSFLLTALLVFALGLAVTLFAAINPFSQSKEPARAGSPGPRIPSNAPTGNQGADLANALTKDLVDSR